ncbi:S24 family peptidase [Sphingomonas sp.]|uniref:S24 family peptidase n=1 Tax=Sphingomonas sp. TaxID=28214 RepID=UPI002BCEA133|nr:S24 family peptidase [Sphingomonas sp.]HWK36523.1 S24 family peptidase [Sphingomonas sp.]
MADSVDGTEQRRALEALIAGGGASMAALSRMLRRNPAWLQQYLKRGTPRLLPEEDRGRLARFFGVDEAVLGGVSAALVTVPRLDIAASAGPGRTVDGAAAMRPARYPAEDLARLGVRADAASEIAVSGDSMAPTLHDGDRILVDTADRRPDGRGAVWVLRIGESLLVKRLVRAGARWRIVSDNPDWPEELRDRAEVAVIGRVVQVTRAL